MKTFSWALLLVFVLFVLFTYSNFMLGASDSGVLGILISWLSGVAVILSLPLEWRANR